MRTTTTVEVLVSDRNRNALIAFDLRLRKNQSSFREFVFAKVLPAPGRCRNPLFLNLKYEKARKYPSWRCWLCDQFNAMKKE
jgi:hypothetical protein